MGETTTRIWRESGFDGNDPWVIETDEVQAADGEKAVLPLDAFLENNAATGVLIVPGDDVTRLEGHLERVELAALVFPAFSDGRAFSHAALLRERLGYEGEIRAVGDVLIDQVPLMLRCGITSFAVSNPTALKRLEEGRLPGIDLHYQPAVRESSDAKSYSWRRTALPTA